MVVRLLPFYCDINRLNASGISFGGKEAAIPKKVASSQSVPEFQLLELVLQYY